MGRDVSDSPIRNVSHCYSPSVQLTLSLTCFTGERTMVPKDG